MLEHGHPLSVVTKTVDALVARLSLQRLQQLNNQPMSAAKIKAIHQACADLELVLPELPKPQSQKPFPHAPWNQPKRPKQVVLDPAEFTIIEDYFQNQDKTPTQQISTIRAQSTGICIATIDQAAAWIREGQAISSDELGLLVLSKSIPTTALPHEKVTFPCRNKDGNMVLLNAILVQLGGKLITHQKGDPQQIPTQDCHLVAITVYKQDWSTDDWTKALHQTATFIKDILHIDKLDQHLHSIWGRSLRNGRSPSSPAQTETIQMHCTVDQSHLLTLLKRSGFNHLFMTPKDSSGRIDMDFRVIWTEVDMIKAVALSTQTINCLGVIRGRNGALGLRFHKDDYNKAWNIIHPGKAAPTSADGEIWKLQGLPFGCTQQMVEAWCIAQKWDCKPFKSLGPQTWLLKTTQDPPKGLLMFNCQPVLLTYVPPKQMTTSTNLILGPRSKTDPWLHGQDPWAGSAWAKPANTTLPPRSLEGPAEARFKQQDEQLEKMKSDIAQLSQQQEQHAQEVAKQFKQVESREKTLTANMQDSLRQLQQGWDKTLQSTMQHHSQTMDKQFQELKALFQTAKRKSPDEGDEEMRWLSHAAHSPNLLLAVLFWILVASQLLSSIMHCHFRQVMCLGRLRWPFRLRRQSHRRAKMLRSGSILGRVSTCLFAILLFMPLTVDCRQIHSPECVKSLQSLERPNIVQIGSQPYFYERHFDFKRIGEAQNPGPDNGEAMFRVAITNPTSIVSKRTEYESLRFQQQVHVVTASETAATATAQQLFASRIGKTFSRQLWSPAVSPHRERSDGELSVRGKASGVALLSCRPARIAQATLPTQWQQTSRILHTIVDLGAIHCQMIVIYGLTSCTPGSHQFNSDLIQCALDATTHLPLPAMVLGDFNGDPFAWDVGSRLQQMGYHDLTRIHQKKYGQPMPPTCRDVTHPDNALLCPLAMKYLQHITAHTDPLFDTHAPVFLDFHIPVYNCHQLRMTLPKSFMDFDPNKELLQTVYPQLVQANGHPTTLQQWGETIEEAVHHTLLQTPDLENCPGLPRKYRGRCQPPTLRKIPLRALLKPGRPGDYNPLYEIHSHVALKMIKQLRRIQSIKRGLTKQPIAHPGVLLQEWKACLRDRSFDYHFIDWCCDQPELGPPPFQLPTLEYITTPAQLAKHAVDRKCYEDHQLWLKKSAYLRHLDATTGHRQAFAILKRFKQKPVHELKTDICQSGIVTSNDHRSEIYVDDATAFRQDTPISIGNQAYHIHTCSNYSLVIDCAMQEYDGESVEVVQTQHLISPEDIAAKLTDFWQPYWNKPDAHIIDQRTLDIFLSKLPRNVLEIPDLHNLDLWKTAVKKLNRHGARGVDGVTALELQILPDEAIEDLMNILLSYEDGLPRWVMLARTFAVPKSEGELSPSMVRPITVLAQIYRLWSQVLARCIISCMSTQLPSQITGFLPGRSAFDASYSQQCDLEEAIAKRKAVSGCSIDLIKCFNTIKRDVPLQILSHLGVPRTHLTQWEGSMQSLHRCWCLGDFISPTTETSSGCAEGDPMSVVAMLAISYGWITAINEVAPDNGASAYADNWSWSVEDTQHHQPIATTTQCFVTLCGMSIDWTKSWIWATHDSHVAPLKLALQTVTPGNVQKRNHQMELGVEMHYKGSHRLGSFKKRLKEAEKRLTTLQSMPHDLRTKTHLIAAGIFPQVFYGVEVMPLGSQHTDHLRTQISSALFGRSPSRNSAVAVAITPKLRDPEVELAVRVIKAARRYLLRVSAQKQKAFLERVAKHTGEWNHCHGPAGSLKFYLRRFGWQSDKEGSLHVATFVTLSLRTTGIPTIIKWLQRSWQHGLLDNHSDRKEWQNILPISIADTQTAISKFSCKDQRAIINECAGGFQTAAQQAAWDPDTQLQCKHCEADDSRYHRLQDCPVAHIARQKCQDALTWFNGNGILVHELPMVITHESQEWLQTVMYTFAVPDIAPTLYQPLHALDMLGHQLIFYTDGSCQNQHSPNIRHAAFAIVVDTCVTTAQRQAAVQHMETTGTQLPQLQLLMATLTPGEPGIHRSELYAIVEVCERFSNTLIYSDSMVALTIAWNCQQGVALGKYANADDFDLIERLSRVVHLGTREFRKIKAHEDLADWTGEQLYHQIGNQRANDSAIHTATHFLPQMQQDLAAQHTYIDTQITNLRQIYTFHLEAHEIRARADAINKPRTETETRAMVREANRQLFVRYAVSDPWTGQAVRRHLFEDCAWGKTIALAVHRWMTQIRWPKAANVQPHQEVGISWLELALSFMFTVNLIVPVARPDQNNTHVLKHFATWNEVHAYAVPFSDLANSFSVLCYQVQALADTAIWPDIPKGMNRSLYLQGAAIQTKGFQWRPQMPHQERIYNVLEQYLRLYKGPALTALPSLDLQINNDMLTAAKGETPGEWGKRCHRARMSFRKGKTWRAQGDANAWEVAHLFIFWTHSKREVCQVLLFQTPCVGATAPPIWGRAVELLYTRKGMIYPFSSFQVCVVVQVFG